METAVYFKPELFLNLPNTDFICPICLNVMENPHLLSCCGSHICQSCQTKFENAKQDCPSCHEPFKKYSTLLDKGVRKKISILEMRCSNMAKGCEWQGKCEDLVCHIEDDCPHHIQPCPNNCGGLFPRSVLVSHKCAAIGEETTTEPSVHHEVEINPPLPCSNAEFDAEIKELNNKIESMREIMSDVKEHCQALYLQLETKLSEAMETLRKENMQSIATLREETEERIKTLDTATINDTVQPSPADSSMKSSGAMAVASGLKWINCQWPIPISLASATPSLFPIPPCLITMTNFSAHKKEKKEWFSPPIYSSPTGYRFVIGITASGNGTGKDSHVSLTVYLAKGEHDGQLKWPFRGRLNISLLNWKENKNNVDATVVFDDRAKVKGLSNRVMKEERASNGCGFPQFIPHNILLFNASKNTEYLRNDNLCFQITEINNK